MWLYQKKLILLEKEFNNARDTINELQKSLAERQKMVLESSNGDSGKKGGGKQGGLDLKAHLTCVKLQLDLAVGMIRLLKEQAGFYLKLGEKFDLISLVEDMVREFSIRDRDLAVDVLVTIDARWKTEFITSLENQNGT